MGSEMCIRDRSKTAIVLETLPTAHAIRTPWARRLPTRPFQRGQMLECIGILRHGPKSQSQGDWLTIWMPEHHTILPTIGSVIWEPRLQHRNDNVGNRYSVVLHVVLFWITYRNKPEPLPCAKPMLELASCDPGGFGVRYRRCKMRLVMCKSDEWAHS